MAGVLLAIAIALRGAAQAALAKPKLEPSVPLHDGAEPEVTAPVRSA